MPVDREYSAYQRAQEAQNTNEGERWTIRNVPRETQERAVALARRDGVPVGVLVCRLIAEAEAPALPPIPPRDPVSDLERRVAALEQRGWLARVIAALRGRP